MLSAEQAKPLVEEIRGATGVDLDLRIGYGVAALDAVYVKVVRRLFQLDLSEVRRSHLLDRATSLCSSLRECMLWFERSRARLPQLAECRTSEVLNLFRRLLTKSGDGPVRRRPSCQPRPLRGCSSSRMLRYTARMAN